LIWPASIVFELGSTGMAWVVPAVGNVALTAEPVAFASLP